MVSLFGCVVGGFGASNGSMFNLYVIDHSTRLIKPLIEPVVSVAKVSTNLKENTFRLVWLVWTEREREFTFFSGSLWFG